MNAAFKALTGQTIQSQTRFYLLVATKTEKNNSQSFKTYVKRVQNKQTYFFPYTRRLLQAMFLR